MILTPFFIDKLFDIRYAGISKMILFLLPLFYVKLGSIFTVSGLLFYKKNAIHFQLELFLFILNILALFISIIREDFYLFLSLNLIFTFLIIILRFKILVNLLKRQNYAN